MSRFPYCLIILVVSTCGEGKSESGVEACEYEDANLLFPNTLVSSVSDIRAKTWNKENGIRLASWTTNGKFVHSPSYGHRLMAIGENRIKIRNATRADTGTYTLVLTSGSTQVFIESTLHLDVLVPPTIQCSPKIVQEGDTLRAVLPPDDCGIPSLAPSWTSGIHILINMRTHTASPEVFVLMRDVIVLMPRDCPWTNVALPSYISLSSCRMVKEPPHMTRSSKSSEGSLKSLLIPYRNAGHEALVPHCELTNTFFRANVTIDLSIQVTRNHTELYESTAPDTALQLKISPVK